VAKLCTQCGKPLVRENSRFCYNCGAVISSNASASRDLRRTTVISGEQPSVSGRGGDGARPALREQIAFAPSSASSSSQSAFDETPSWMSRLDKKGSHSEVPQNEQREEEDGEVQDLPTIPVPSTFAPEKEQKPSSPPGQQDQHVHMNGQLNTEDRDGADLPTRPLAANVPLPKPPQAHQATGRPFPAKSYRQTMSPQVSQGKSIDQQRQGFPGQAEPLQSPIVQRPVTPALPVSSPGIQQAAPVATGVAARPSPSRPVRRKSKMRLVVVLSLLLLLVAGGLVYWIAAYQPFSVPAVTQTSLSFSNTGLGIATRYPQGWTAKLDSAHQTVSFFDANHTDQVTIVVAASNGQSVDAYVKKEVAQPGLTAQKNLSPLTFAGTSWQQVQGTVLVSGATYTETLLVAARGDHFYTFTQMAPAATYADADHLFFAILRASFKFL
jgi:hypothetical protein